MNHIFPLPSPASIRRRGAVLILVLWMMIILGVLVMSYTGSVHTQLVGTQASQGRDRAWWAAQAGIEKARAVLQKQGAFPRATSDSLFNSDSDFKNQSCGQASFSLIAPPAESGDSPHYGLVDEASRVNINNADENGLTTLPHMTPLLAQSLIDWRDGDAFPQPSGAEDDYYLTQSPPYRPRNKSLTSLRELYLVRGWRPWCEAAWPDAYTQFAPRSEKSADADIPEAQEARELLGLFTVWSRDYLLAPDGQKKLNLTTVQAGEIAQRLSALTLEEATAIVNYRTEHPYQSSLDLLNVTPTSSTTTTGIKPVAAKVATGAEQKEIFDLKRVGEIIDYFDVKEPEPAEGLININTASFTVLMTIKGMTNALAEEIMTHRGEKPIPYAGELAKIVTDKKDFRAIYPAITVQSNRYHVYSRGDDPQTHSSVMVEAVLEQRTSKAAIIYWREI